MPTNCKRQFLLAPQSGALSRLAFKDFHPIPSIQSHVKVWAFKPILRWSEIDQGRPKQTKEEPGRVRCSRLQPGMAGFSEIQPGTASYSQVQPLWYLRCYMHLIKLPDWYFLWIWAKIICELKVTDGQLFCWTDCNVASHIIPSLLISYFSNFTISRS